MHAPPSRLASTTPRLVSGLHEIADDYDAILCDVWGVVHNGARHFPAAAEALARFRAAGKAVVLITNAPRPRDTVIKFLDTLGLPHNAYDALLSSGDVTISLILERQEQRLAHIGPVQDRSLFATAEAVGGRALDFADIETADFVVCTGFFDAARETPQDYAARFDLMRRRDLDFICANPDSVVEVAGRLVYCAGALAEAYAALGGRVIQAGKPYPPIYARALAQTRAVSGQAIDLSRVLAIGDAMGTDIKGAHGQGLTSLFVTSGIHRAELQGDQEDAEPDGRRLRQLFEEAGFAPHFAMTHLIW